MSEIVSKPLSPEPPLDAVEAPAAPRSWLGRVLLDTFGRTGARIGLLWIVVVAFGAIFAPLLANTNPILIKIDGTWSSPMMQALTPADCTLLIGAVAGIVLAFLKRVDPYKRLLILLATIAVALITSLLVVHPKFNIQGVDYYRAAAKEGRVQWVLNAPIPYSPGDSLSDQFDLKRPPPHDPSWVYYLGRWGKQWTFKANRPTWHDHILGTDQNGNDIFSNLIHACRIAMSIGFISTGIGLVIGIVVGGLMGYFVGWVDLLGMRLVEIFSSIPTIYLLLTFVAYYGSNIYMIMAIIGVLGWTEDARFVRAEFLRLRNQDFVHAAVASGLPLRSILFRHLLPNALAPLLVSASFGVAYAIILESTLSFLGLGVIGEPSWGRLLYEATGSGGSFKWWLALFPGLAIFLTVFSYNLIGESMRDALDPKLRGVK